MTPCIFLIFYFLSSDCGCSTAFIRVWAALGLATDLQTVDTATAQRALAEAARTHASVSKTLEEQIKKQRLPEGHYLKR